MPKFTFTSPDGKTYEIEGPEGATSEQAFQILQKQLGSEKTDGGLLNTAKDVAKSLGIGVAKGAIGIAGLPGDIKSGVDWAADKLLGPVPDSYKNPYDISPPNSSAIRKTIEGVTGEFYSPQTTAGKYAQSVGEMAPAVMAGPGSVARKAGQAIGSGLVSEGAGQLTEGSKWEPAARIAGAVVGGYAPDIVRKVVTPNPISPERQRLVDILNKEGVTSLTAGQKTGKKSLQYAESILGDAPFSGGKTSKIQQEGQRQFTEATMRRAGTGADATPEVLSKNYQRLGGVFDDLSARNNLVFDPKFGNDLIKASDAYARVPPSQQKAIVEKYFGDILDHATSTGGMSGTEYQKMRSRLSAQAQRLSQTDPDLSEALRGIRNALDDNMRRVINPADRAAWDLARKEYSAQKIIEKAASRAGEATAEGQITPANLRNTVAAQNRGAYARGGGDFSELARSGAGVMAPLPNSGTAQRNLVTLLATGGGGALGGAVSGGLASGLGAVGGLAAPGVAGRVLMSNPIQKYLANQLIAAPTEAVKKNANISQIVNALIAARNNNVPTPTQ